VSPLARIVDPDASLRIVEACRPLIAGHHAAVQGAALADLLAIWLAGHPAGLREALLGDLVATAIRLIPVNEAMIRGGGS
jgi:hypothetical protein